MVFTQLIINWNKMTQSFGKAARNGGKKEHILYMCRNSKGEVIRVGQCNNLNDRMNNYKTNHICNNPRVWEETTMVERMICSTKALARELEDKLIKQYQPELNVRQK